MAMYQKIRGLVGRAFKPKDKAKEVPSAKTICALPAITKKEATNPRLDELLKEKSELEQASTNLSENIDALFARYEATPVTFKIYLGPNYGDTYNADAQSILNQIFGEYARLEYPNDDEGFRSNIVHRLKQMLNADKYGFFHDAASWRLDVAPLRDTQDIENVLGVRVTFLHNYNGYPKKSFPIDSELNSQIRYRKALNEVETILIKKGVEYKIEVR